MKGKMALKELRRFYNLPTNIKTHLIKAYILPIIQYPPIPLVTIKKNNHLKLQRIQNAALRFALNEKYPYTHITEEVHQIANTKCNNINIYNRSQKKHGQN